ncbi:MAG: trimethylamine methyltransferase family protein, partial [Rhodobacterales bacterium]
MSDIGELCEPARARRSGGRASRVAERSAPLAENLRPVRPGLPGGQYRPLTEAGMARIHASALDALEQIGLSQAPPSGVELLTGAGAPPPPRLPGSAPRASSVLISGTPAMRRPA